MIFAALFVVWCVVILSPCLVITLAIQREIVITYSDLPEDALRIWTISEPRQRGVAIANSRRVSAVQPVPGVPDASATCTIIDTRFLMWEGSAEAAHQCSCYVRRDDRWQSVAEGPAACVLAGEAR
jgi:hypothetical protein